MNIEKVFPEIVIKRKSMGAGFRELYAKEERPNILFVTQGSKGRLITKSRLFSKVPNLRKNSPPKLNQPVNVKNSILKKRKRKAFIYKLPTLPRDVKSAGCPPGMVLNKKTGKCTKKKGEMNILDIINKVSSSMKTNGSSSKASTKQVTQKTTTVPQENRMKLIETKINKGPTIESKRSFEQRKSLLLKKMRDSLML